MNTIALWRSFEWKTLTLRWHARCADPDLTAAIVIRRAAALLEARYQAVVKVSSNGDALRFRHSWWDTPFVGWLLMGRVTATDRDGEVTVVASGSVALLLLLALVACALLYIDHRPDDFVAAVPLPVIAYMVYVAASDALKEVSADVVKPD